MQTDTKEMVVKVLGKTGTRGALTFHFTEEEFKSATVLQLKTKIRETEGIPEDKCRLLFDDKQLEDQRLLSDCRVKHEDTIHLVLRVENQIFVKTGTGTTKAIIFTEEEFESATVLQLKRQKTGGIPEDQQRLVFGGEQLEDQRLLSDYRVKHEDTIYLVERLRGVVQETSGAGGGGMGDKEGRNQSMETLSGFSKCTVC
ncbi:polyubiquitin-like [Acanthopagrus schlegelii]